MRHKIARIGSWCCVMAVFMCCVSISANAATTSPIWYWINADDFISGSGDSEGYYVNPIDGTKWAIVYPGQYDPLNGFMASRTYLSSQLLLGSRVPNTTGASIVNGYIIGGAWEPYSYYNFSIDSTWRICSSDILDTSQRFCFADKNNLAYLEVGRDYTSHVITDNNDGTFTELQNGTGGSVQKVKFYQIGQANLNSFPDTLSGTNNLYSHQTMGNYYSFGDSVNINDLIVWSGTSELPTSNNILGGVSENYARFYLMCPKALVPAGLKPGDIWPVGNPFKKVETPEETAVNQYSGDAALIDQVGIMTNNGIGELGNQLTTGTDGFPAPSYMINTIFDTLPWLLNIFALMFLFGLIGVLIRRALHD